MDGTEAGVYVAAILGASAPLTAAIIKFVPRKHINGKGDQLARVTELVDLRARVAMMEQDVSKLSEYSHKTMHTLRDLMHAMQLKQAVMSENIEHICDRLRIGRRIREENEDE
jgi:hypothetical protein